MNMEIERKFLVTGDEWRRTAAKSVAYRQGYLTTDTACTVRVRLAGDEAWLTIKGTSVDGAKPEFEYAIPPDDASILLDTLAKKPLIEKIRHFVPFGGFTWEVDEFSGDNTGLILAEIELASMGQEFPLPPWAGEDVTGDGRYYNANLVATPFSQWGGR